jgi:hypothetical protein
LLGRCRGDFNHYGIPPYEKWAGIYDHRPQDV